MKQKYLNILQCALMCKSETKSKNFSVLLIGKTELVQLREGLRNTDVRLIMNLYSLNLYSRNLVAMFIFLMFFSEH